MKNLKILMITDHLEKGGKERRMVEMVKGFSQKPNMEIEIVVFKNKIHYKEIYNLPNVNIHILVRRIKKDPTIFIKFFRLCRIVKPDIIHSWGSMPTIYAIPSAKLLRIKLINAMATNAICPRWSVQWWRKILTCPFSDIMLSNSYAGLKAYKIMEKKGRIIYNGFTFDRIEKMKDSKSIRKKFFIGTNLVVGMVATFTKTKDYDTFIKAAEIVLKGRKDITFISVGDGPYLDMFRKRIKSEFQNKILFLGELDDVESVINIMDICVLTTNNYIHREGVSNSIMEYMALGKPVIATEGGGTNEIIVNNETGIIIKPDSQSQVVQSILFLIDHPVEAKVMGDKGREKIKNSFSFDQMIDSTLDLYEELLH